MKYKLLKQIEEKDSIKIWSIFDIWDHRTTLDIDIPECQVPISFLLSQWYIEEVKEPKTIYDLKKWDNWYVIEESGNIWKYVIQVDNFFSKFDEFICFTTEREAKRNKLLRELATREKWLPKEWEYYFTYQAGIWINSYLFQNDESDIFNYHTGFIFRDEEEYSRWITEDNKNLLFNI